MPIDTRPPMIKAGARRGITLLNAAQLRDLARMRPVVNHADDSKEESRHHAVREHLHAGAQHAVRVEGGKTHQHQAHVRNRGKTDDIFEIGLHHGDKRAVDHVDQRQQDDPGHPELGAFGQQHDADPQGCKSAQLHQHTRMEHRDGGRCCHVTIRAPVVEGEDAAQHGETQEDEREPQLLEVSREIGLLQQRSYRRCPGRK